MASKISIDATFRTLCKRSAQLNHRSIFVLKGTDVEQQVAVLYHLLHKASTDGSSTVLWCHKHNADLPKSSRKAMKVVGKKIKSGEVDHSELKLLDILLHAGVVKFCSYGATQSVLGNTYKMCILQDVECLTPNIVCRVVETVQGGGAVVLLLHAMQHLRQLCNMDMEVHYKLTTHSHPTVLKLFNNRLALSLAWCRSCIIADSDMSASASDIHGMNYKGISLPSSSELEQQDEATQELTKIQEELADAAQPLPQLAQLCKTADQARVVMKLVDVITEKRPGSVVSVTAGRGRGKSAALGLAVAAAVDLKLTNIYVTSPSPHNLTAFFQLLFEGFDALNYKEEEDYKVFKSTNPDFAGAIVRVMVTRKYRQIIQYVLPCDYNKVQHPELFVVDEAAAIPLPQVQGTIGEHITFMASTISGYEGTGRSLSLKLLKQLRRQSTRVEQRIDAKDNSWDVHELHEVSLSRSIRYSPGDPVEEWLNKLFCLDATSASNPTTCPAPSVCQLYAVNKKVLFSGNKGSEQFLLQVQSLLVSSHYRNSPDDLQVLADAPAHHLFVLMPPISQTNIKTLPPVLCVVQVCLEGGVSETVARRVMRKGERPSGDLATWMLATQYRDPNLATLVGARVIRVATHPDFQSMGYGSRALQQLQDYYSGRLVNLTTVQEQPQDLSDDEERADLSEQLAPKYQKVPLLFRLSDRLPDNIDYISVSYGLTHQLFTFWARAKFLPLYVGQTVNQTTGEHNCMMVYPVKRGQEDTEALPPWLSELCPEFVHRFTGLLFGPLSSLNAMLASDLIRVHNPHIQPQKDLQWRDVECVIKGHDLRRLGNYSKHTASRHVITDLVYYLAKWYCKQRFPQLQLSKLQAALLVGKGLQNKEWLSVGTELGLKPEATLGNFSRAITRIYRVLAALQESMYTSQVATVVPDLLQPVDITAEQDLNKLAQ
ncbi:RNA cytidine acetyltransferase NAT10, partial [Trinorchestia longiramus]